MLVSGCRGGRGGDDAPGGTATPRFRIEEGILLSGNDLYREAGLIAQGGPVPFIGNIYFMAGASPDTTVMLLALSLSSDGLTFAREDNEYRAGYDVSIRLTRDGQPVREIEVQEHVSVGSLSETARTEESIIFQQFIPVHPGEYVFDLIVRDSESAQRTRVEGDMTVPRLGYGDLSTAIPVYQAKARERLGSIPELIANPRATAVFGLDTTIAIYIEAYPRDSGSTYPLLAVVQASGGDVLWSDSTGITNRGELSGGTIQVPVSPIGIGMSRLGVVWSGSGDTTRLPLFVGFGAGLPVISFGAMIDYLEFFASPERLRALKDAAPISRATAWSQFLRETDPVLSTPENEALRDYFVRVRVATLRFRDDGSQGWRSDRGMVYTALGEPDQVTADTRPTRNRRGQVVVWEYLDHRLRLIFIDQTGFGRWELTAGSEGAFWSVLRRIRRDS